MAVENKYITLSYELYVTNSEGQSELMEKAPAEHPFQFISGMGVTLDAFEAQILPLNQGDSFDFTLSEDEAYGPYIPEGVRKLDKQLFYVDGKFAADQVYEGNVVPLMDSEGNHMNATVTEVTDTTVEVDLNHPLAGKELHFVGKVECMREATNAEIEETARMLSGEGGCGGCGGGCGEGGCGGCEGGCGK
jgi:FKBP-type peptidyl-prolyl cis-trans isomerase SlyD